MIKNGEVLNEFESLTKAAEWIIENKNINAKPHNVSVNIGRALTGRNKKSYGYEWKTT